MKKILLLSTLIAISSSLNAQNLTQGLIGHWPLDGNANDISGSNNGTITGAWFVNDRFSNSSKAIHFGSGDYISIPSIGSHSKISFSFWVKINQTPTSSSVFLDYGDRRAIVNFTSNTNTLRFWGYNSSNQVIWSPQPQDQLTTGTWHHIVATMDWDNKLGSFYIDGTAIQENVAISGTAPASGTHLFLGGENGTQYSIFDGDMDDMRVYNRILSSTEIGQLYNYDPNATWEVVANGIAYSNGNVGIGTTSPTKPLSVNGDIGLKNNGWITFKNSSGSNDDGIINYNNTHRLRLNYGAGGFLITKSATNILFANDLGNVGIGTTNPNHKLEVNGTIRTKKVKVEINHWPDYVFSDNYKLRDIKALEAFIKTNKHLPEVPSAKEVEANGLDLGTMDATLLKKVEELTLYMIVMKKEIEALKKENKKLSDEVKKVRK